MKAKGKYPEMKQPPWGSESSQLSTLKSERNLPISFGQVNGGQIFALTQAVN